MARKWLLVVMPVALGLSGLGASVSRNANVSLFIPAISVLSLPEWGLSGREVLVELRPEDLAQGFLIPIEVRSNVPWAVTAQVLPEGCADLTVQVLGGPEVLVATEELPILSGRPGKHEVLLLVKLADQVSAMGQLALVLRVTGAELQGARTG